MKEHQHRGLTSAQVEESRRLHGDNLITPRKGDSAWKLFAEKFRDPIIQVLLVAALLSLAMAFIDGEFLETIGIICAIVLATCVGFFFELDAMRRFKRLNLVNDDIPVKVVRDGEMTEVPRRDVVVGDLVYVENGETVPADGKLVKAVSLKINESTLTGEPEVDKTTDERFFDAEATYPSDALLRGTTVVDGYGEMIVEAVGDRAVVHSQRGAYTAVQAVDASFADDRQDRYRGVDRDLLGDARQGIHGRRAFDGRLGPDFQGAAAYFYGFGGSDRDGCSRGAADEHHALAGVVDASDVEDE